MMYNLTYLGHRVTLPWLDLRSNFDLDLSRSNYTWFDAPWRDKHDGIKIVALPLKLKILSSKNRFGKFWIFDPWWRQFWPEPKNDRNDFEMIFRELSNAVFRFVLRCAGAEIDGGVFKHPPPPAGRGKSRGPAGRGLTFALLGGCLNTPLRFFADSKKTAARSAAGFSPTSSPIFLATFVKVSILGHARSGHQVRSSDHTLQKLYNRAPATVFEGKLWSFRNMVIDKVIGTYKMYILDFWSKTYLLNLSFWSKTYFT